MVWSKSEVPEPAQVFDRALKRAGGRNWWTVLLGRMRAQRIWKLHRTGERSVSLLFTSLIISASSPEDSKQTNCGRRSAYKNVLEVGNKTEQRVVIEAQL